MNESHLDRLRDVVLGASEVPSAERSRYLDRMCGDDEDLRRAAAELLALDTEKVAEVRGLADGGVRAWLDGPKPVDPQYDEATAFARYVLREEIGRGGSSVVHRAEQTAPVAREVALKILRARHRDPLSHQRFLAEQQVLATLEHPNVARVFDADTTPDGLPFFAMELVRGESITEYASCRELSRDERVRLFLQACAGVEHAHRRGVIHRDLKPSNLLVAEHEGQPVVKVIDFGIARPLDGDLDPRFTLAGHMLGTPQYMSPEQARDQRDRVDVRTDVFSLGVVLHEMLTGVIPYDDQLDTALSLLGAVSRGETRRRPTDVHGRPLPRDLAAVVDRVLAVDTEERYASCADFSRDLENWMAGRPVSARKAGALYTFGKLVGRHPLSSGLVAALLLLIIASSVVSTTLYQRAEREADDARRQAATATSLADYLQGMFAAAAPTGGDKDVTMSEVLDDAIAQAERDLADQPYVLARVLTTIGNVKADLGEATTAHDLWKRAIELLDGLPDAGAEELQWRLAKNVAIGIDLHQDFARMRREVQETIAGVEASGLAVDVKADLIYLLHYRLADAAGREQRVFEADDHLAAAAAVVPDLLGDTEPRAIQLDYVRGRAFAEIGHYARAHEFLAQAFAGYRRYLGTEDNRTLVVMNRLAGAETGLGRFDVALDRHHDILRNGEELLGPDHIRMAYFHYQYGITLTRSGRPAAALAPFERAGRIFQKNRPEEHKDHTDVLAGRGEALLALGRHEEALAAFERGLVSENALSVPRRFAIVRLDLGRGIARHRLGDLERAAEALAAADAATRAEGPAFGFILAEIATARAWLELARGRVDTALAAAEEAMARFDDDHPGDPRLGLFAAHARAQALAARGDMRAARAAMIAREDALLGEFSYPDARRHAVERARTFFAVSGDQVRALRYASFLQELAAHVAESN